MTPRELAEETLTWLEQRPPTSEALDQAECLLYLEAQFARAMGEAKED